MTQKNKTTYIKGLIKKEIGKGQKCMSINKVRRKREHHFQIANES